MQPALCYVLNIKVGLRLTKSHAIIASWNLRYIQPFVDFLNVESNDGSPVTPRMFH